MTLDFSIADETLQKAFAVYKASRSSVVVLAPIVILLRVAWGYFRSHGPIEFLEILKDLVICVALLFFFQQYVEFLLQIPVFVSKSFGGMSLEVNVDSQQGGYFFQDLARITNYVSIFSYWIAKLTYYAAMLVMIGLAAWAIFAFIMFGIYGGLFSYLAVMMLVALVPAFWIAVNFALTILFESDSPVRNNILITLGNCGKAVIAYKAFMMALHEPFLKPLTNAFRSSVGGASKAMMAAKTGGLSLASGSTSGITAFGGGHLVQGASTKMAGLKATGQSTMAKTIPTAESLLRGAGKSATSLFSQNLPNVARTASQGMEFFKSKTNPYTGKSMRASSPMRKLLRGESSFASSSASQQSESSSFNHSGSASSSRYGSSIASAPNSGSSFLSGGMAKESAGEKTKSSTKTASFRSTKQNGGLASKSATSQANTALSLNSPTQSSVKKGPLRSKVSAPPGSSRTYKRSKVNPPQDKR